MMFHINDLISYEEAGRIVGKDRSTISKQVSKYRKELEDINGIKSGSKNFLTINGLDFIIEKANKINLFDIKTHHEYYRSYDYKVKENPIDNIKQYINRIDDKYLQNLIYKELDILNDERERNAKVISDLFVELSLKEKEHLDLLDVENHLSNIEISKLKQEIIELKKK